MCGRHGREKDTVGLKKWMGAVTHSLASVAKWVGSHLRSSNRESTDVRRQGRDCLGEGPRC